MSPNLKAIKSGCVAIATALVLVSCRESVDVRPGIVGENFPEFSSEQVNEKFDPEGIAKLEARMEQFVTDGDTAGIATLLVQDGKVISHSQAGVRRIKDGAPITEDTIYRIYSMTKPITGVAMMQLYEQGKFKLDDPVSKYIPEFEDLKVVKSYKSATDFELEPLQRQPTLKELMSHTAGFAYWLGGSDPSNAAMKAMKIDRSADLNEFVATTAKIPLMHQPGEKWFYSASVDLQGAIIERLSGQSLGAYFKTNIFDPLGMVDSGFYVPDSDYDRFSEVFYYNSRGKLVALPLPGVAFKKETIAFESGGGGLVSTLQDYSRFCQALADGGVLDGTRVLKSDTVKLMRTNVLNENQKVNITGNTLPSTQASIGFGLNFGTVNSNGRASLKQGDGTYYWGGAAGTWFWIDPEHDLFFIGMIQRFPQNGKPVDFRGISRDLVYDALKR